MSPLSLHKLSQKDILLAFIQGSEGIAWANNRTGWDRTSGIDGKVFISQYQ